MAPSPGKSQFSSGCTIERVILLGQTLGPKYVLTEPSNQKAEVEVGPLLLRPGRVPAVLTIRNPNVRIVDDWTIKFV